MKHRKNILLALSVVFLQTAQASITINQIETEILIERFDEYSDYAFVDIRNTFDPASGIEFKYVHFDTGDLVQSIYNLGNTNATSINDFVVLGNHPGNIDAIKSNTYLSISTHAHHVYVYQGWYFLHHDDSLGSSGLDGWVSPSNLGNQSYPYGVHIINGNSYHGVPYSVINTHEKWGGDPNARDAMRIKLGLSHDLLETNGISGYQRLSLDAINSPNFNPDLYDATVFSSHSDVFKSINYHGDSIEENREYARVYLGGLEIYSNPSEYLVLANPSDFATPAPEPSTLVLGFLAGIVSSFHRKR